jgi:fructokinase
MTAHGTILVAGEALYDLWVDARDDLHGRPGGGPFNTARTIARLRQPVSYLGRMSTDRFGTTLVRLLEEDGVGLGTVVRTDDPTTLAFADIDPEGGARYSFYERGTSAAGLTPEAALSALPSSVSILHVGTLGITLEPVATATEAVIDAVAGDTLIAVDPNVRPWVINDPDGYRDRLRRILRRSDLVKVSEEDLDWLDPGRAHHEAARALLGLGPSAVLLTRGARGALAVAASGSVEVPVPPAKVVDTIGAGDAFGGGFLAWWRLRELGREALGDLALLEEATRFASLVAARTCERAGASPPYLDELQLQGPATGPAAR